MFYDALCRITASYTASRHKATPKHVLFVHLWFQQRWCTVLVPSKQCAVVADNKKVVFHTRSVVNRFRSLQCHTCNNYPIFCNIRVWDLILHWIIWHIAIPLFLMQHTISCSQMQAVQEVPLAFLTLPAMYETECSLSSALPTLKLVLCYG